MRQQGTRHKAQGTRQRAEGRCQIETVIGNRLSVIGNRLSVIGFFLLLATRYSLLTTCFAIDYGETEGQGGVPAEYLFSFGPGAEPLSVGGAYTARAGAVGCVYYNPAGIGYLASHEVSVFYSELFSGTKYSFLGYGFPIKEGEVIEISYVSLSSPESTRWDKWEGRGESFQEKDATYLVSYGHLFNPKFTAGGNLKFVYQNFCQKSTLGYGIDAGILYKPFKILALGLNLQDALQPKLELPGSEEETLPLNLRAGLLLNLFGEHLLLSVDAGAMDISGEFFFRWHAGGELRWKILALRGGINYKELTAGIGIVTRKFQFDYGASFHQRGLTHRLSISARYGLLPTVEEQEIALKKEELKGRELRAKEIYQEAQREREAALRLKEETIARKFSLAKEYLAKGNYKFALTELQEILKIAPENKKVIGLMAEIKVAEVRAEEKYLLALECYANGNYKKAEKLIKKGLKLSPRHAGLLLCKELTRARIYLDQQKYTAAKQVLLKIVKTYPGNEESLELLKGAQKIIDAQNELRRK